MAADIRDDAQAPDIDDGLDDGEFNSSGDGGYDNWDGELSSKHVRATDLTITKGGSALSGLHIEKWTMTIDFETEFIYAFGTLSPVAYVRKPVDFTFEADVSLTSEASIDQMYTLYGSKTIDTFKIAYDADKSNSSIYVLVH